MNFSATYGPVAELLQLILDQKLGALFEILELLANADDDAQSFAAVFAGLGSFCGFREITHG